MRYIISIVVLTFIACFWNAFFVKAQYEEPLWKSATDRNEISVSMTVTARVPGAMLAAHRVDAAVYTKEPGNAASLWMEAAMEFRRMMEWAVSQTLRSDEYVQLMKKNPDAKLYGNNRELTQMLLHQFPSKSIWINPPWFSEEARALFATVPESGLDDLYRYQLREVWQNALMASRKSQCDWNEVCLPTFESGVYPQSKQTIPEQEMLCIQRFLADRADWQIRTGKMDDAIETIRVMSAATEHTYQNSLPCLLSGLTAISLQGRQQSTLLQFVSHPNAPNLYREYCILADQIIRVDCAIDGELRYFFRSPKGIPNSYSHPDELPIMELDRIGKFLVEILDTHETELSEKSEDTPNNNVNHDNSLPFDYPTAWSKTVDEFRPAAVERLRQRGLTDNTIEKLDEKQIIVPYLMERIMSEYEQLRWGYMEEYPIESPSGLMLQSVGSHESQHLDNHKDMITQMMKEKRELVQFAILSQRQNQVEFEVLIIIEALRWYAALHDGQLPVSLDELSESPISLKLDTSRHLINYAQHDGIVELKHNHLTSDFQFYYQIKVVKP